MEPGEADANMHSFLEGGGELGRRIAAYDWDPTPIGSIETWPPSLRTSVALLLRSPVPIVLLWGEHGVMIYNDAYSVFAGGRNSRLLGSNVREGWPEVADFNDNVMRVGLAGGTLSYKNQELTLFRNGQPEQVWMNLDYSPVTGEDGKPAGVIAIVVETTEAHRARAALKANESRLRFLDDLSREIGNARNGDEILGATTRMTAEHLQVSNCAYADMDEDEDGFTIRGDWHAEGSPSIVGHYSLASFGRLAVQELGAGRPLIINDNLAELAPDEAAAFQNIGIAATICMPLIRDGRLTALMAIHDRVPRRWTDYELGLIQEVTERSWAHVERVRAEDLLREREVRNRQILDSATDYGIIATDLEGVVTSWNAGAASMLGWTEAEILGQPICLLFTEEDRADGRPERLRQEALTSGSVQDQRWHARKSGERFWGLSELAPLRDQTGAKTGLVAVIRDQTEEHRAQEALRVSEDRLRRAQVAGSVGLFSLDIGSNMISGTPEFCRIFGFEPGKEIRAEAIERLIVPEDADLISNAATRRSGRAALDVEYRIRRADTGEERIIARKAEYECDEAGVPLRLVGAVQDTTERRGVQLALERSVAQFGALAQHMPTQVWTARADGYQDWFNAQIYAFSGARIGDLDGEGWMRLLHPEDRQAVSQRWTAALTQGTTFEAECRLRHVDGNYRWTLVRAVPLRDAKGAIASWVGTNTDIDAQKLAEAASARDRNRLWSLSQDLMLICDFDGVITAVNPSAERLLGWTEEEMVGRRVADFLHPEDQATTSAEVGNLSAGRTTFAFENRYRAKIGEYRLLAWTAVPEAGRIHAVGRDITEQRSVEEALRQSQKMEAVGQLTGGIAHDFNNLLQGISGSLDVMANRLAKGRTDDLGRWLHGAKTSASRAAALTHRLLAFSRRQPLDPRPVRPNPLVSSMEDLLRRTLGENIALELALDDGLWLTRCDPNQLESAILNLAINARDAMPNGGTLRIETANADLDDAQSARERDVKAGQYVRIAVSDNGVGMSREVIGRAFEPFFTTKPLGQGTGLGLSMVYGFARQSEGHARISSEADGGTAVELFLPRFRGDDDTELLAENKDSPGAEEGEVVLVVEDEPVVRSLIVEVLDELGYRALEARDGPEGLAVLQSDRRIDLLITDIGLPGLNGRQVADGGRVVRPELKVLFMTGYAESAALASGFLEPGMAMMTKPFAMNDLADRIRSIIGSGPPAAQFLAEPAGHTI